MPAALKFFKRLECLWRPTQDKFKQRLECACGVTRKALRTHQELALWKEDRDQRVWDAEMSHRLTPHRQPRG
eukprot:6653543-Pyramimonas_sp.AAC.1